MLPIGGSGSHDTSVCQPSPLARGESLSAWMIISSGMPGSDGAAGCRWRSPNSRPKARCCSSLRCWSRKKMTEFSASARCNSSICRLPNGWARSIPPISAPMIGVSLSRLMVSYSDSCGVYLIRGPFLLRSELIALLLLGGRVSSLWAEDAAENRLDVLQMIGGVERGVDCFRAEMAGDFGIGLQPIGKTALAAPGRHRVGLHQAIGVLAAHPGLGQGQQETLRVDEAAE